MFGVITASVLYSPNSELDAPMLLAGVSTIIGMIVLFALGFWFVHSFMSASMKRVEQGNILTVYDAMSVGAALPVWWKQWYGLLPLAAILVVGLTLRVNSVYFYFFYLFVYCAAGSICYYFITKR